jgi:hypothetical protein
MFAELVHELLSQHHLLVPCNKHKMILNFKNNMTSITVIHKLTLLFSSEFYHTSKNIIDKSNRLKGGGFNLSTD